MQVEYCKDAKNGECNDLLDYFQLKTIKAFYKAYPVCRHLKAVFKKSNGPAYDNDFP